MKPLNLDNSPCSPISSNCVIWQGPNLDCIKLCTGDTVSDVTAKLASELCVIMDELKVSNYDLSCFDLVNCKPDTFQALLQFLIEQICKLNNIQTTQSSTTTGGTKESTLITVAPCFVVNGVTVMTLTDYVVAIGLKVCNIVDQIADIQNQIDNLQIQLDSLEVTVNNGFTYTLPSIPTNCFSTSIGLASATIDIVLNALVNDPLISYCALLESTGLPADIYAVVLSQCITNTTPSLSFPGDDMQTAYGPYSGAGTWQNAPTTAADAINNLWIALCDIQNFLSLGYPSTVVTAGDGIDVISSTVGSVTTYQVSAEEKPGLSVYAFPPNNLNRTAPDLSGGQLCDGTTQVLSGIEYNDFGAAYDSTTGVFTVPVDGVYTVGFFSHFSKPTDDGWYDVAVQGMFIAGITSPTNCNFYCVNNFSATVIQQHASINGSITRNFTAGTQLCVKVINLTNFNYTTQSGDVVRFFVQRVK
jgi:hypothetical protein